MSNLRISAPLVNGDLMPYIEAGESCEQACEFITGDDLRPPARAVTIEVQTKSGKTVVVTIPNHASSVAKRSD
jgi:hypothetical protein